MPANLSQINRIFEEHQAIRANVRLVGESVSDQEALNALKSARSDWAPQRTNITSAKLNKLKQTTSFLKEGLVNHFNLEAEVLPPILGKVLMQALLHEHQEIMTEIDTTSTTIANTHLEGLSQDDLITEEANLTQMTNHLSRLIEEHAEKEEMMLEMVQHLLREES